MRNMPPAGSRTVPEAVAAAMQYDEYIAAGYPIGSGAVEAACRHLVNDRMEGSGMRWTLRGAKAVLQLRALYLNGDWRRLRLHRSRLPSGQPFQVAWRASSHLAGVNPPHARLHARHFEGR